MGARLCPFHNTMYQRCHMRQPLALFLAVAVLASFAICAHASNYTSETLVKAVNQVYQPGGALENKGPAQYIEWLEEVPARLRAHKAWWSSKAPTEFPVTVSTVATASRLYQLEAQCGSWAGPLSAVVYLPITVGKDAPKEAADAAAKAALADAEKKLGELHSWAEKNAGTGCYLDVMLLYEYVSDEPLMGLMFPVNALRNFALVQARTPLVALIDVDLLISRTLAAWLDSASNVRLLMERCRSKTVVVLPAFETEEFPGSVEEKHLKTAHKVSAATVKSDKRTVLSAMVSQGLVHQFDKYTHLAGHYDTNYDVWFNATDMYAANLTKPTYEPWFIIGRHHVPLYDVRFRGFGYNKQVHILQLKKLGFQFLVHPEGFLVHRAHPRAPASQAYVTKEAGKASVLRRNVTRFFGAHMDQVNTGKYRPCVDQALLNCHKTLPWAHPIKDAECVPYVLPEDRNKPFVNFDEKPKLPPGPPAPPLPATPAAAPPAAAGGGGSKPDTPSPTAAAAGSKAATPSPTEAAAALTVAAAPDMPSSRRAHHRPAGANWHKVKLLLKM